MGVPQLDPGELITTVRDRAPTDDPLVLLDTAVSVAADVGEAAEAAVDHFVAAARATGLSWTAIGERLGVSKQAARQKFSSRLGISGGPATEPAPLAPPVDLLPGGSPGGSRRRGQRSKYSAPAARAAAGRGRRQHPGPAWSD